MTGRWQQPISLRRETALEDGQGRRHCAHCGDFIDPKDWCMDCQRADREHPGTACGHPHRRLTKRADAAYCNQACRTERRSSYIRDCL